MNDTSEMCRKEDPSPRPCPDCRGRGTVALFTSSSACCRCGGHGWIVPPRTVVDEDGCTRWFDERNRLVQEVRTYVGTTQWTRYTLKDGEMVRDAGDDAPISDIGNIGETSAN